MELRQLRFFLAVAERLNFSRAATALYISQPALSCQIAELERELGVELFFRDRRKVFLSPAGAALLPHAREVLDAAERLRQAADGGGAAGGPLRVGFDNTEDHFECTGVTDALARFATADPPARLEMRQAGFDECVELLFGGELDLAFLVVRHNEGLDPGLACETVHEDRLALVVREEGTEDLDTCEDILARLDLVLVSGKPRGRSRILRSLNGLNPRIRTVDSLPASFTLAQTGRAAMVLPRNYYLHHGYAGLKAVDIPGDAAFIAHCAVWNKNAASPLVGRFLEMMRAGRV